MRSALCGKEGEREKNGRSESREVKTWRRKIIIEHRHNVSCGKRQRRSKCGAYWVRTAGGREMAGRGKMKACACPPEGAAQIPAGEELLFPCFRGSKSKCSISVYVCIVYNTMQFQS